MLVPLCPQFTCTDCVTVNISGSIKSPLRQDNQGQIYQLKMCQFIGFYREGKFHGWQRET